MSKKIIGVTVGTPISPNRIAAKIKPVKTVNGTAPDENGNVNISVGVTSVNGQTGVVTVSVPTQTNQLTNNSGFITKAVSDLTNYYLKSETLTKTEINTLVSAIPKFTISVVSSLPTSNISETTVYLVKSGTGGDLYTEYIYVNGAWEILGSQKVDLTGYVKNGDDFLSGNYTSRNTEIAPGEVSICGTDGKGVIIVAGEWFDGYVDGKAVLSFCGTEGDEPSILRSIADPIKESDAANKRYVDAIKSNTETWTFTLANGSTVTKKVVLG